jgi:ABC-type dipeptide/oligopeptide/nickel transport system permease subunit
MSNAQIIVDPVSGTTTALPARTAPQGRSLWADAWIRIKRDRLAMVCLFVVIVYAVVALLVAFGLLATTWGQTFGTEYQAPSSEKWQLWFGADIFGRSVLLKTIYGCYISMTVGFVSSMISIPIGVSLGALAGYFGAWVDELITWFYTTISNIPSILLILSMAFVLGKGLTTIWLVLGITSWVGVCRLIRGEFMKHKEREYVQAARSLGASNSRRIFIHILPNVSHLIIINFSFLFVSAIKTEVILSYLGMGVQGVPSWGTMIDEAKQELARGVWWQLAAASGAMLIVVLALNILIDALRDALDPKLK